MTTLFGVNQHNRASKSFITSQQLKYNYLQHNQISRDEENQELFWSCDELTDGDFEDEHGCSVVHSPSKSSIWWELATGRV